ncbi:MAG TPA: hypothetical protein VIP48_20610, partial [Streptosporangiaceae bacterium]
MQRGQPVLVAELAAEGQRLLGQRQRFGRAAALGQQPGQVVQRGHGRPPVRQPAGLGQALPQLGRGGRGVAAPGGQHAEHVAGLGHRGRVA